METPLLRVSRPVSACQRCRSAKIKCDGLLPACTACTRSNRAEECASANDQFAKGKERSYVASLESRIERLEKQIAQRKSRPAPLTGATLGTPQPNPATTVNRSNSRTWQRKEAGDVDDLVSDFGFMSVNATARDFYGFTEEMSFAKLVLSTSLLQGLAQPTENTLPSRYEATQHVQLYLDQFHVLYPILSETALFGSLEAVYQQGGLFATAMDHWNIRMVFAIATASSSEDCGDSLRYEARDHVYWAFKHAEAVLKPGSVLGIQAILLLVIYTLLDPLQFNSWYPIGVASRAMVDLGLHQDPREGEILPDSHLRARRRIYSCVYTLDRAISMTKRRAFSFTDDSANVALSVDCDASSFSNDPGIIGSLRPPNSICPLYAYRRLQSKWYQVLFESDRQAQAQPWQYRSNDLYDMHEWAQTIQTPLLHNVQFLCQTESLYGKILIISPTGSVQGVCEYGKALIFQYAMEFSRIIQTQCRNAKSLALCTSLDLTRTLYVGEALIEVLQIGSEYVNNSIIPASPAIPKSSKSLPKVLDRSSENLFEIALTGLRCIDETLSTLSSKFELSHLHRGFKDKVNAIFPGQRARYIGSAEMSRNSKHMS